MIKEIRDLKERFSNSQATHLFSPSSTSTHNLHTSTPMSNLPFASTSSHFSSTHSNFFKQPSVSSFSPLTATQPITTNSPLTTTTSSTSYTHCNSPIMGMSPLQPVEVVLNKNRKLIKIGTVSKLACKLAQHSIFGEDNLKSVLQWVEESYHPFQGRKCLN